MKRVEMSEFDAVLYYLIQATRFDEMATQARAKHQFQDATLFNNEAQKFRAKASKVLEDDFQLYPYHMHMSDHWERFAAKGWDSLAKFCAGVFVRSQKQFGLSEDEAFRRLLKSGALVSKVPFQ